MNEAELSAREGLSRCRNTPAASASRCSEATAARTISRALTAARSGAHTAASGSAVTTHEGAPPHGVEPPPGPVARPLGTPRAQAHRQASGAPEAPAEPPSKPKPGPEAYPQGNSPSWTSLLLFPGVPLRRPGRTRPETPEDKMSDNSAIEWTTHTFNPWWGCSAFRPHAFTAMPTPRPSGTAIRCGAAKARAACCPRPTGRAR